MAEKFGSGSAGCSIILEENRKKHELTSEFELYRHRNRNFDSKVQTVLQKIQNDQKMKKWLSARRMTKTTLAVLRHYLPFPERFRAVYPGYGIRA